MTTKESNIKRNLKSRHITMIAIGGCIGSGLFMTSGQAISKGRTWRSFISIFKYRFDGLFPNDFFRRNGNIFTNHRS